MRERKIQEKREGDMGGSTFEQKTGINQNTNEMKKIQ